MTSDRYYEEMQLVNWSSALLLYENDWAHTAVDTNSTLQKLKIEALPAFHTHQTLTNTVFQISHINYLQGK